MKEADRDILKRQLHPPFNEKEVVLAFEKLAHTLKDNIQTYDIIIGDDVSGRLPTIVVSDLARRKRNQLGLSPPTVLFVNAGSNISHFPESQTTILQISDRLEQMDLVNKRVLLVTEYVCTGESILALANQFKKHGITPDLCILASTDNPHTIQGLQNYRIFYPSLGTRTGNVGTSFFFNTRLTGVRSPCESAKSERLDLDQEEKARVIQARQDMKLIASEMWKIIE